MKKKIILAVLIILWAFLIFSLSSQRATDSDRVSKGIAVKVIKAIDFNNSMSEKEVAETAAYLNFFVRKGAHFCAYAVLGVLIALLFREFAFSVRNSMVGAVALSGLYACTDEFHQTYIEGRSGEIRDVGIDTVGALFGVTVFFLLAAIIKKCKNKKKSAGKS